jgi:formamidopyrimidine-DNA glycosylase
MPELPEVQTIVNDLKASGLTGAAITGTRIFWPGSIDQPLPNVFCRQIKGLRLSAIRRRGKYIVFDLSGGYTLLIHLRMSGHLNLVTPDAERSKHEHVVFDFNDCRQLRLHDTRKFGRFYLLNEPGSVLNRLGPEPLEKTFTLELLFHRIKSYRRMLKPLLLDQTFIAGLGNIYADEALWEAKIHPCRLSSSLSDLDISALHRAIPKVLKRGVKNLGTTLGSGRANFYSVGRRQGRNRDQLKVFRRTGLSCPRCKTPIERIVVGQRSTHICRKCQK